MNRMNFNPAAAVLACLCVGAGSGVPTFNTSRAETLASLDRFKQLATNLQATVIIQHDARDIDKLPAFPASAK
jgi:N-acyl homoserine lactone hydrolase